MIHKDMDFGGNDVYALLEFGNGDIGVVNGHGKKDNEVLYATVMFKNITQLPIGSEVTESGDIRHQPVSVFPPQVTMTFTKVDSIDVVIHYLNEAKARLKELNQ